MRVVKILAILAIVYVGIVVVFESLIGYLQPENESTLVLITTDEDGDHSRVLTHIEYNNSDYVAVNHWPRAWYHRAKENPDVQVTFNGETAAYTAIPVTDTSEFDALQATRPQPLFFRFLIGFAPREFVRLEPVVAEVMPEAVLPEVLPEEMLPEESTPGEVPAGNGPSMEESILEQIPTEENA